MKRKTILVLIIPFLVLMALVSSGQTGDEILKRLKAKRVKSNIFLFVNDDKVTYKHDVKDEDEDSAGPVLEENGNPMWMAKSPTLKLSIGFYNPYQYTIKVTSLNSDDPLAKSTEQLMEALLSMVGTITTGLPVSLGSGENLLKGFGVEPNNLKLNAAGEITVGTINVDAFKNASLIEWSLWAQQPTYDACLSNKEQNKNLAENARITETILEGNFYANESQLAFDAHVLSIATALYEPTSTDEFLQALSDAGSYHTSLSGKVDEAGKALNNLKSLNELKPFKATGCEAQAKYQNLIFNQYILQAKEKLDTQRKILKTVKELIGMGNQFVKNHKVRKGSGDFKELRYVRHLDLEDDQINTVTLDITHNELDTVNASILKTQSQFKRSFQLTKFRRAWPEFSSGLFFSDIEYNIFSEGSSTIMDGSDTTIVSVVQKTTRKQNFMAAVFYNHVFDFQLHPLYPFVQVGVGSSKDYPALVLGGGARYISKVSKPFSVSFGMVLPFTKELDGLEENAIITGGQAEIDRHVRYKLGKQIGFYVGINIKIN